MKAYKAKNIIVSLDFDGVLAHGIDVKKKYAKQWFGVDLELSQTKKKGFNKLMKEHHKAINYRDLMDPLNEKHIMEYKLKPNCKTILKQLYHKNFRYVIITSRNNHDYPYAKKFSNHHFKKFIKYIHNTRNEPKTEFVRKIKPRVHLDDDIRKLEELKEEPIHLAYFRQPENKHQNLDSEQKKFIQEINNWNEFKEYLLQIKELHEAICWKFKIKNTRKNTISIIKHAKRIDKHSKNNIISEYYQQ
ncbi:MAG: hypothetical protein ACQESC_04335 [Nanobdellota archaeon]